MQVRIIKDGKEYLGVAVLSPSRRKASVCVTFTTPIQIDIGYGRTRPSYTEEFRLSTCSRLVWGQGMDYDTHDYFLREADAKTILAGGGG